MLKNHLAPGYKEGKCFFSMNCTPPEEWKNLDKTKSPWSDYAECCQGNPAPCCFPYHDEIVRINLCELHRKHNVEKGILFPSTIDAQPGFIA